MDDFIETDRAPSVVSDGVVKSFGEHSALTVARIAEKPPRFQDHLCAPTSDRQVEQSAQVAAVNTASHDAAKRARTRRRRRPDRHHDALGMDCDIFDDKARWDKF
jgi:hypothetical protein